MPPPWMQPGVMGQQLQQPPRAMAPATQPPAGQMGQQGPWMMGQPYHGQWIPQPPTVEEGTQGAPQVRSQSEAIAAMRATRKEVETNVNLRHLGEQRTSHLESAIRWWHRWRFSR